MVGVPGAVGILALLALLALVGWMLMRVPDPNHAAMLEMLSGMDRGPEIFISRSHHACGN